MDLIQLDALGRPVEFLDALGRPVVSPLPWTPSKGVANSWARQAAAHALDAAVAPTAAPQPAPQPTAGQLAALAAQGFPLPANITAATPAELAAINTWKDARIAAQAITDETAATDRAVDKIRAIIRKEGNHAF
jgi:hypothetical protein